MDLMHAGMRHLQNVEKNKTRVLSTQSLERNAAKLVVRFDHHLFYCKEDENVTAMMGKCKGKVLWKEFFRWR